MTSFLKSLFVFMFCIVLGTVFSVSAYEGTEGFVQRVQMPIQDEKLTVSYMLNDQDDQYFNAIQDELKAGKSMQISHEVEMRTLGMWSKKIARKQLSYYVSYDLFSNEYTFDEGDGNIYRTSDEDMLRAFLFTVKELPLVNVDRFSKKDEYVIKFFSSYKEDTRNMPWYKKMTFNLLRQNVKDEVVYVAK